MFHVIYCRFQEENLNLDLCHQYWLVFTARALMWNSEVPASIYLAHFYIPVNGARISGRITSCCGGDRVSILLPDPTS